MSSAYLDAPPRSLEELRAECEAEMARLFKEVRALYATINVKTARIEVLEERAAKLYEEIILRSAFSP